MQRLVLAALFLAIAVGVVAVLAFGVRATLRQGASFSLESEGSSVQKLAFAALILLIVGVSTGFLGGL